MRYLKEATFDRADGWKRREWESEWTKRMEEVIGAMRKRLGRKGGGGGEVGSGCVEKRVWISRGSGEDRVPGEGRGRRGFDSQVEGDFPFPSIPIRRDACESAFSLFHWIMLIAFILEWWSPRRLERRGGNRHRGGISDGGDKNGTRWPRNRYEIEISYIN